MTLTFDVQQSHNTLCLKTFLPRAEVSDKEKKIHGKDTGLSSSDACPSCQGMFLGKPVAAGIL